MGRTALSAVCRRPRVTFKMKVIRWLAITCVVLLLAYVASPYFSFWRFTVAVRSRDAAAIGSRVDFPAVRASLKRQLVARLANQTSSHKRWSNLGPTLIDAIVDAYVTPQGIAALLSNPEPESAARVSFYTRQKREFVESEIRVLQRAAQFCCRS